MARLIIGHVTPVSAKIWVRGEKDYVWANITVLEKGNVAGSAQLLLEERHGYTGCAEIKGLKPATAYTCQVSYARDKKAPPALQVDFGHCRGKFMTAPEKDAGFSFLLGSCNLHSLGFLNPSDDAFEALTEKAENAGARFMIHCGDQIYYDIPVPFKQPSLQEYRQKYLDAWQDCRPARAFLTQLPQYMILDDHEIANDFSNDFKTQLQGATPAQFKYMAMKAYREFVHIRHPETGDQAYYYSFSYGGAQFFVLDTRTERWAFQQDGDGNQIISKEQMTQLKKWLLKYSDVPKFIVSSVPFVAHVRRSDDKWSSEKFLHQRDQLIEFMVDKGIRKVVFLTGDMHNSYHATLDVVSERGQLTIHELMSSPLNQLEKSSFDKYDPAHEGETASGVKYTSIISRSEFYNAHSNAMLISVKGGQVGWEIFRTKKSRVEKHGSFAL